MARLSPLEERIRGIILPSLTGLGYTLVQLRLKDGGGRRQALEIMAERTDGKGMTIEDCTDISHTVSALMDVEDPIKSAYALEVSSPGPERPLNDVADFRRFAGAEAKVELDLPMEGRKRFRGTLGKVTEKELVLHMPEGDAVLELANIRSARLAQSAPPVLQRGKQKKKAKK